MTLRVAGGVGCLWLMGTLTGCEPSTRSGSTDGAVSVGVVRWTTLDSLVVPRYEAASIVIDGQLFLFGGFHGRQLRAVRSVDVLDPETGKWTRRSDMPDGITHRVPAADGADVWFAGGFVGDSPGNTTDAVWRYDSQADTWTPGIPLPEPRAAGALVRMGRRLHFMGGYGVDRNQVMGEHWTLDLDRLDRWVPLPPMPDPRAHMSVVSLGGKVFLIGGVLQHDPISVDVDWVHSYDPESGSWSRLADLPVPRSHTEPSTFVSDGRIIVIGGRSASYIDGFVDEITAYDPALDRWISYGRMPDPLLAPAAGVFDSVIVVASGRRRRAGDPRGIDVGVVRRTVLRNRWQSGEPLARPASESVAATIGDELILAAGAGAGETFVMRLSRGRWEPRRAAPDRPTAGSTGHAAAVVEEKLYLIGGSGRASRVAQAFDPAEREWRLLSPPPFPIDGGASVAIGDRIYVAGGIVGGEASARVAVYHPVRDEWTELAPLPRPVAFGAAGTDGTRMWVFGGRSSGADSGGALEPLPTVQRYDPDTDSWDSSESPGSMISPLDRGRSDVSRAPFIDGRFYVIGGLVADGEGAVPTGEVSRYDPTTGRWEQTIAMPTARAGVHPVETANRLYVIGGVGVDGEPTTAVEVFTLVPPAPAP